MLELDEKYDIVNEVTPANEPLRAHFKKSFAYYTISERLPVILTQVVDQLSKDKDVIVAAIGTEKARDDIKECQGAISSLKYELQTDKKFADLTGNEVDREQWNEFLASIRPDRDSYFTTVWLYAECYMYRRLRSIFESTNILPTFDYFAKQKKAGLTASFETIQFVVQHVADFHKQPKPTVDQLQPFLIKLLKLSLWGNRCDLSISLGRQIQQEGNAFTALESLDEYLLVDRCESIWRCLLAGRKDPDAGDNDTIVDVVLDNSGYELFTDLVLVHFLLRHNFAGRVRFHVKAIPWFISDVMHTDFAWTLEQLASHSDATVAQFGGELVQLQRDGRIEVRPVEFFWTGPWEFRRMAELRPDLYADLAQAHLVLFKGDLNYRKLLGDFNWDFGETFETVLSGFRPTNVCSLRTVKADLVCELKPGVADALSERDAMWMETGQYGVVHFASKE